MTERNKWVLAAGAAAIGLGAVAVAQHGLPFDAPTAAYTARPTSMPFALFRDSRIFLNGKVNGVDTDMMLDSGAALTVLDSAFAKKLGVKGVPTNIRGAGGSVPGEIASDVTLEVGSLRLTGLRVFVFDMGPTARAIGRPVPVVLGQDAFRAGIVSIDFPKRAISFSPSGSFHPPAATTRLDLTNGRGDPSIGVSVAGLPPVLSHIDLGNSGTILLSKAYWAAQPSLSAMRHARSQVGGVGGMTEAREVTLPELTFGGVRFANVPATFNEDPGALPTSGGNIGVALLKTFVVTFDVAGGSVYLQKTGGEPVIKRERAGVRTEFAGDRLKVAYVSPDGPGAAAGLKAGDVIVAVDGQKVDAKFFDRPDWTQGPVGRAVTLTRADGTIVKVTLADYF